MKHESRPAKARRAPRRVLLLGKMIEIVVGR